jgi:hypothetical protein
MHLNTTALSLLSALQMSLLGQTVFAQLTSVDIGSPAVSGSATTVPGGYSITGGGTNIAGNSDQFFFAYETIAGDFDVKVRVASLSAADVWSKAGLMARETVATNSRHASVFATPSFNGCFFSFRSVVSGPTTNTGSFPVGYPNTWLRLRRVGAALTGYSSLDGQTWMQLGTLTLSAPPASLLVGVAATGANASQAATAEAREYGTVAGGTIGIVRVPFEPIGPSSRNTGLIFSEIMYHPRLSNALEFIEIFSTLPNTEDLTGWRISGDVDYAFPAGTLIRPGQFLVVARDPQALQTAYGISGVLGPWSGAETNALPDSEGTVRLRNRGGAVLLEVVYEGSLPWPIAADGAGHSLVLSRPSWGEASPKAWSPSAWIGGSPGRLDPLEVEATDSIVINEFLAHTDDPLQDFIELFNPGAQSVNVSGLYLTDDRDTNKFRVPNNTVLSPRGFIAFNQTQLGFSLSSGGERIYLVNSNQTRVIDTVAFEAQANGVSSGRFPDGAPGLHPLQTRTEGTANSGLLIGPIVINELMFHPISEDENADEYVELYNRSGSPVNVGNWRFIDGIDFTIPANTVMASNSYLVIAKNAQRLRTNYAQLNSTNTIGNYGGNLANGGERLALAMPDYFTVTNNNIVLTQANYIVVDEVIYSDQGRWTKWADGGGSSLELIDPNSDNGVAANWADSDETAKAEWTAVDHVALIDNVYPVNAAGATHNEVQLMILGAGEMLIDDIEVRAETPTPGPNLATNGTFTAGLVGWARYGNHIQSSVEAAGPNNPSSSLHLRATAGGDNGANLVEADLSSILNANTTARLGANVRWLRGHRDVLLRLHGGGIEAVVTLPVPNNLGSPGLANSRRVANAGPAIYEVDHNPALPAAGQPVVITARVSDPDGIGPVQVQYRLDPSATLNNLVMRDDGTGGDAIPNDGLYSATLSGQSAGTLVAFRIQATDAKAPAPASTVFPPDAPARECLIRFGDPTYSGSVGVYRMWMTAANISAWTTREVLSNEALDGTMVYNNFRVIYNAGARYRGSPFIRPGYNGPTGGACGYVWTMPEDDLFLGQDELNLDSLEPSGRDSTALREITAFSIIEELGWPASYQRFVHVVINGVNNTVRGIPIYSDSQQPNSSYIASWFPDSPDGEIFKIDDWFEFTDAPIRMQGNKSASLQNFTTTGGVKKQARYRWSWEKKFNRTLNDDYSSLFAAVNALNSPSSVYVNQVESLFEIEEWLGALAFRHVVGDWDGYGYNRGKNQFAYRLQNGKFWMLQWDLDFALGCNGGHGPQQDLFSLSLGGDTGSDNMPEVARLYNTPHFRRMYLRTLLRIATGPLQDSSFLPNLDARYRTLQANNVVTVSPYVGSGAQSISIPAWLQQRRTNILTHADIRASSNAAFSVTSPLVLTTNGNLVTIAGTGPLLVKDIRLNGLAWPVIWTSITGWTARVVLDTGTNDFFISGTDVAGNVITSTQTVTINYTGPAANPQQAIVINEILYHPSVPEASFVELLNRGSVAFDLGGWRVNGLDYTFPPGSILAAGQFLTLVQNRSAFATVFGTNAFAFDQFDGNLDLDGETLTLLEPGTNGAPDLVIDKVRYEARAPWAAAANGTGSSLQVADADQDNARVSNWGAGFGWQFVSRTGNILNGTNVLLWIVQAGNAFVDDISLIGPEGTNVLRNGGFESGLAPWMVGTNYASSVVVDGISHSGSHSLFLNGGIPGNPQASAVQQILDTNSITLNTNYTLSFYALYNTNSVTVTMRTLPGANLQINVATAPVQATPGALNLFGQTLPPYDPLWLNEVQPNNTSGIMDNNSEREPWIELYNAGGTALDLSGYYLANNYDTNLTQWQFPGGSTIQPGEFKIVWADGQPAQTSGTNLHTNFRLASGPGSLALVRLLDGNPQITDYLTYSSVGPNLSYGDYPDGQPFNRVVMFDVTPRGTNIARTVNVFINEWMAANTNTLADPADADFDDWFELYNAGTDPADLGGYFLTDDLGNRNKYMIPTNGQYVIPPGGFLLVWADGESSQNNSNRIDLHAEFNLRAAGEAIGLFTPDGSQIDAVTFGPQTDDVSEGRFADGALTIYPMTVPTPRGPNTLGGSNNPPVLAAIPDWFVPVGHTVSFVASASDPDPGQTLTFRLLPGFPAGASINPSGGQFQWTPAPAQSPSTNSLTVEVADNGVPRQTATRSFTIVVAPGPTLTISGNTVSMSFPTIPGKTYRVDYKNSLSDPVWIQLAPPMVAGTTSLGATDTLGANPQRFYRIVQLN